jgi:hypothetical protein
LVKRSVVRMSFYPAPAAFVAEGGEWPEGPFLPSTPTYAITSATIVRQVLSHMGDRSIRSLAAEATYDASALSRLLRGLTVPDLTTVLALEDALGQPIIWRE